MISYITGQLIHRAKDSVIVNVNGIGYSVFVPARLIDALKVGSTIELHTHLQIREDSHDLFGFLTREELELFKLLLTVKGVGPKTALSVLNQTDGAAVSQAIASGDPARLAQTAGIGLKNSERIVLDLKNKIVPFDSDHGVTKDWAEQQDVVEALVSLGYSAMQAQAAVKSLPGNLKDSAAKVKAALKLLNK